MADHRDNALVRCEFGTDCSGILRLAQVVTPDQLDHLPVDTAGIIDLFEFQIDTGLDVVTVCGQITRKGGSHTNPDLPRHGSGGHTENQGQTQDHSHK